MDFIDIHTHQVQTSATVFAIENKYPNASDFTRPFSIGIHPWYIQQQNIAEDLAVIASKLMHPKCMAIGECGLDKLAPTSLDVQLEVFRQQIALSETYHKPIIIHCVRAFNELIALKKELKPTQKWIVHGFSKNKTVAQSLVQQGIYLSFGEALLTQVKVQEAFLAIAETQVFLETDAASTAIESIYQKAAALKNTSVEKLQKQINTNFSKTFFK